MQESGVRIQEKGERIVIVIPPDVRRSLRTLIQKEVLDVLAECDQFMCPAEINEKFAKRKNGSRLADALEILVEKGYVEVSNGHRKKLYRVVASVVQGVTPKLQSVTPELQSVTPKLQSVTSKLHFVTDSRNQPIDSKFESIQFNQSREKISEVQSQVSSPEPVVAGLVVESVPAIAPALPDVPKAENRGFRLGLVFRDPKKPEESLNLMYERFFDEDGMPKMAVDPDSTTANPLPSIPMAETFEKYYRQAYDYSRKRGVPLRDFVLHRIAFFLTYDDDFAFGDKHSPREFVEHGILDSRRAPWSPILADLASAYVFREFGWDGTLLSDRKVWEAELRCASKRGEPARKHLFLSYFERRRRVQRRVRELEIREPPPVSPLSPPATLALPDGEQRRRDPPHPVLAAIAERLGEQRYGLWFGEDADCVVEDGTPVFTVRDQYRISVIRRYCRAEVLEAVKVFGCAGEPEYRVRGGEREREREPVLT